MTRSFAQALRGLFLGSAPGWYKVVILGFLVLNPLLFELVGRFAAGWMLLAEFIFTLAMALRCYPLPPGGLLVLEAIVLGMTSPDAVYKELTANLPTILLLMFMVAGIHFMREMLQAIFTKLLVAIRSKVLLSLFFCAAAAFMSAFLDALTVVAVIITVAQGFYDTYHRYLSEEEPRERRPTGDDEAVDEATEEERRRQNLARFRGFLRNLLMHAAVGTALGGVTTLVGEPQNVIIATAMQWSFGEFFVRMAHVTMPVLVAGLLVCFLLEQFRLFGFGHQLPETIRLVFVGRIASDQSLETPSVKIKLVIQGLVGALLIVSLALHVAEIGLIGLMVIIVLTATTGVVEENRIGKAFEEALPFTALLVVFFAVVAVIHDQHLFQPIAARVLALEGRAQIVAYYVANGLLSVVSDNVFVATVYMNETMQAFADGRISKDQLEGLAVAINAGTNIPSIATPNGQAAFLFLLTSALAPLIRLSYGRMVLLALPYTIPLTLVGLLAMWIGVK